VFLERLGKWRYALLIAEAALAVYDDSLEEEDSRRYAQVNGWFCRQQIGTSDVVMEQDVRSWEPEDGADIFTKALLLGDFRTACKVAGSPAGPEAMHWKQEMRNQPLVMRGMAESSQLRAIMTHGGGGKNKRRR
jgi:hypothetical protein